MTAISDFCNVIRKWLNIGPDEYPDDLVSTWVKMAEEQLSTSLRCKHMITIDTAVITEGRVTLPLDWLALDFVRVVDGAPLHFRSRDDFYSNDYKVENYNRGHYTLSGNYLIVPAGMSNNLSVELTYYQSIPPLSDGPNWLMQYYSRLYVASTLAVASMYAIEDERAVTWQTAAQAFIDQINEEHLKSKASGSRIVMQRTKGFG